MPGLKLTAKDPIQLTPAGFLIINRLNLHAVGKFVFPLVLLNYNEVSRRENISVLRRDYSQVEVKAPPGACKRTPVSFCLIGRVIGKQAEELGKKHLWDFK